MKAKETAAAFTGELASVLGPRLESVLLYGSVARGEYVEGASDINVLVLLDDISAASLAAAQPVVRKYAQQGVHPIVLESREWRRASDVFAIEISDMQDAHEALHGHDPLADITVQLPILRLQAERELRGKQLQIYLTMLVTETPDALAGLLKSTVPSLVTYYRTALRLAQRDVPQSSTDVLRAGGQLTGSDPAVLLRLLEERRAGKTTAVQLSDPMIDTYNDATETLVTFIDNFGR